MQIVDKGLILRESAYKDADVMLTVLTECAGKISVLARGTRRKSSRMSAAVQFLTYSEFTLYEAGGRYTLNEAEPLEMFYGIRNDIVKLSLASYFAEILEQAAETESINPELLRLGLNALYALSNTSIPHDRIKASFELRAAAISGYRPSLFSCVHCGKEENLSSFDLKGGGLLCSRCDNGQGLRLEPGVIEAMRFITTEDIKKIFSFNMGEKAMRQLQNLTEEYLSVHFERRFKTNAFYKSLLK